MLMVHPLDTSDDNGWGSADHEDNTGAWKETNSFAGSENAGDTAVKRATSEGIARGGELGEQGYQKNKNRHVLINGKARCTGGREA